MRPNHADGRPPLRRDMFLHERVLTHRILPRRLRGDRVHGLERRGPRQLVLTQLRRRRRDRRPPRHRDRPRHNPADHRGDHQDRHSRQGDGVGYGDSDRCRCRGDEHWVCD